MSQCGTVRQALTAENVERMLVPISVVATCVGNALLARDRDVLDMCLRPRQTLAALRLGPLFTLPAMRALRHTVGGLRRRGVPKVRTELSSGRRLKFAGLAKLFCVAAFARTDIRHKTGRNIFVLHELMVSGPSFDRRLESAAWWQ